MLTYIQIILFDFYFNVIAFFIYSIDLFMKFMAQLLEREIK